MKRMFVLFIGALLLAIVPVSAAESDVVGDWDCKAIVDMTYPFALHLAEEAGNLGGYMSGDQGRLDLQSVSYQNKTLKFQIDYPEAGGMIEFEGEHKTSSLEGTLGNYSFTGTFSCKPKE
jgi:hypothetical protein